MSEYSGKLLLRIDPQLHRVVAAAARERHVSINTLCAEFVKKGLSMEEERPWWADDAGRIVAAVKKEFGHDALGVVVFGSQVKGTATASSDLDILVVLSGAIPIRRTLYRWWATVLEEAIDERINPQFVHLPENPHAAGGIWYEIALASHIVWERGRSVSAVIVELKDAVAADHVRRYWSHGQPYWVRRESREEQGSGA